MATSQVVPEVLAPAVAPGTPESFPDPFHHSKPTTVSIVTVSVPAAAHLALSAAAQSSTGTAVTTSTSTVTVPSEGFWGSVKAFFEKFFGSAAKWEQIASSTLTLTAPLIVTLADVMGGPAEGTAIGNILSAIQTDMTTAGVLISQANATPTLTGALTAIQTNLQALLAEAQVSNPTSVSDATTIVNLIVNEITAIQKELPATAAVPVAS